LDQAAGLFPGKSSLLVASLAFEARFDAKGAVKSAKKYLKSQRDNLYLWDGYAQLEKALESLSECRKVYYTALAMSQSFTDEATKIPRAHLFREFAELEFENRLLGKSLGNCPSPPIFLVETTDFCFSVCSHLGIIGKRQVDRRC